MEAKLKSAIRRIPWSLVLKTGAVGVIWLTLPVWIAVCAALCFYFVPAFQVRKLALSFALFLWFLAFLDPTPWRAILIASIFYLILGIKDLVLIDRASAYETLILLIVAGLFLQFFSQAEFPVGLRMLASTSLLGFLFFLLMRGFLHHPDTPPSLFRPTSGFREFFLAALGGFVIWQGAIVLLFLPINLFYQSAILFLIALVFLEVFPYHNGGRLTRGRVVMIFSAFFVLSTVIAATAEWNL
ncbi:hypothetical protein C4587_02200 [Candidatus Parcubacteria bacterium]|nr:MAG: hypothetical protein C4587_02200 [Candidatus Parcubacteria bacterium]